MYIKDLANKIGVDQETLEQFIKSKGYEVTSIFGVTTVEDNIAKRIEKEIEVEKEIQRRINEENNFLFELLKCNKDNLLDFYYTIVKHLYIKGVLFVVQDFLVNNMEDYYDLTSYKLDLIVPVYDSYGRISRQGMLFNSEYVLFVVYSIKTKEGLKESNQVLMHVFNGENGGLAYTEKDERKIYENKMNELANESGTSIIEVYSSQLEPNATTEIIDQIKAELIQQAQQEQNVAIAKVAGNTLGAVLLGASAAKLGKAVRNIGKPIEA